MESMSNSLDQAVPVIAEVLPELLAQTAKGSLPPGLTGQNPGLVSLGNKSLVELVTHTDRLVSLAEAARASVLREVEARDATVEIAGCSPSEWLRREHGHTTHRARSIVKDAVRIGAFPALVTAHETGKVSTAQAVAIAKTLEELPDDLDATDLEDAAALLIGFAAEHDPADLARLGWRLLETVAPDRADEILADQLDREEKRAAAKRGLRLFADHHGSWILRGQFTAVEGEELSALLTAYSESRWRTAMDDPYPNSPKDKATLLADSLLDIVRAHQTNGEAPTHGGDRPRVTLILGLGALLTGLGEMALTGGSLISAEEARRLACDCDLIPAVLDAAGVPLDVGRQKRLVTPEIRAALTVRDRGCAFPGCDKPPAVCEAHHIIPWWCGGETCLDNLVLLCPHHHRRVEPGRGWTPGSDDPHRWAVRLGSDRMPEVIPPAGWDPARRPRRHTRFTTSRLNQPTTSRNTPLRR
ncbi:DUF222 domain-containing protein [Granulicoccus sp. GXG6511]|uniref:HNH endonuclease signature motif containing protein n=1 Tax=Granulicoccus sp. GXG6511 TaxID=3381351 RepID=UPI003D7E7A10